MCLKREQLLKFQSDNQMPEEVNGRTFSENQTCQTASAPDERTRMGNNKISFFMFFFAYSGPSNGKLDFEILFEPRFPALEAITFCGVCFRDEGTLGNLLRAKWENLKTVALGKSPLIQFPASSHPNS